MFFLFAATKILEVAEQNPTCGKVLQYEKAWRTTHIADVNQLFCTTQRICSDIKISDLVTNVKETAASERSFFDKLNASITATAPDTEQQLKWQTGRVPINLTWVEQLADSWVPLL